MTPPNPNFTPPAEPPHAPFRCPHCGRWADEINTAVNGRLMIMYHSGEKGCQKILSTQIIMAPPEPPRVQPAGIILPRN